MNTERSKKNGLVKVRPALLCLLLAFVWFVNTGWREVAPPSNQRGYGADSPEERARQAAILKQQREEVEARFQAAQAAKVFAAREVFAKAAAEIISERDSQIESLTAAKNHDVSKLNAELKKATGDLLFQIQSTESALREAEHENAKRSYVPKDPYRLVNGKLTYAKGADWLVVTGVVTEVQPNGICLMGAVGPPLETFTTKRELFISGFPYPVADHEEITEDMRVVAQYDQRTPTYTYTNAFNTLRGGRHTVRRLNYGTPAGEMPDGAEKVRPKELPQMDTTPLKKKLKRLEEEKQAKGGTIMASITAREAQYHEELDETKAVYAKKLAELPEVFAKQARDREDAKKGQMDAKALAWHQELAKKGDPYGLCQMGRRYLRGEGVEADTIKAKAFLQRAVELGSQEAKSLLETMGNKETATNP